MNKENWTLLERIVGEELISREAVTEASIYKGNNRMIGIYPKQKSNYRYDPYFKYFDSSDYRKSRKVARISILRPEYIKDHTDRDGKSEWVLNSKEKRQLMDILYKDNAYNDIINSLIEIGAIDQSVLDKLYYTDDNGNRQLNYIDYMLL